MLPRKSILMIGMLVFAFAFSNAVGQLNQCVIFVNPYPAIIEVGGGLGASVFVVVLGCTQPEGPYSWDWSWNSQMLEVSPIYSGGCTDLCAWKAIAPGTTGIYLDVTFGCDGSPVTVSCSRPVWIYEEEQSLLTDEPLGEQAPLPAKSEEQPVARRPGN